MAYVAPTDLMGAQNADLVVLELHNRNDGKMSGKVIQILEKGAPKEVEGWLLQIPKISHLSQYFFFKKKKKKGLFIVDKQNNAWVIDQSGMEQPIYIPPGDANVGQKKREKMGKKKRSWTKKLKINKVTPK